MTAVDSRSTNFTTETRPGSSDSISIHGKGILIWPFGSMNAKEQGPGTGLDPAGNYKSFGSFALTSNSSSSSSSSQSEQRTPFLISVPQPSQFFMGSECRSSP